MLARLSLANVVLQVALVAAQVQTTDVPKATTVATASLSSASASASRATGAPCLVASSVLDATIAQNTDAATVYIPADIAYACIQSVPLDKTDAVNLIDGISAFLEFESDLGILKNPPSGYLLPGTDLLGSMSQIRADVLNDSITMEWNLQTTINLALAKAHDGHLGVQGFDALNVFTFSNPLPALTSVSLDGQSPPQVYAVDDWVSYASGHGDVPSAVAQINGVDAAQYITTISQNFSRSIFQDPNALYNVMLYSHGSDPVSGSSVGLLSQPDDPTVDITYVFANKSTKSYAATARFRTALDYSGMVDGPSFYKIFCNATNKIASGAAAANGTGSDGEDWLELVRRKALPIAIESTPIHRNAAATNSTPAITQVETYPMPVEITFDGILSGYFLNYPGFEDTAVLALLSFDGEANAWTNGLKNFLALCRKYNKKRLLIDLTGNGGGTIGLGYDTFKQLFPDVIPYGAGTYRASSALRELTRIEANITAAYRAESPLDSPNFNRTDYFFSADGGGLGDLASYLNDSGQAFSSWAEFFGPVATSADNYTNLFRNNYESPDLDELTIGGVPAGYGNNTQIAPSPFTSDNIVLLTDGQCGSTCTIFAHFMKWQGKVKSIASGGRPIAGPMQAIGGIKGSQVEDLSRVYRQVRVAYFYADIPTQIAMNQTALRTIYEMTPYLLHRFDKFSVNAKNNIAEGDSTYTPLQYVYEAADCRQWYQPAHVVNVTHLWLTTAANAFGLNGTKQYEYCVSGSTGQPSSLSGNATLYNDGNPTNVTVFHTEAKPDPGQQPNSAARRVGVGSLLGVAVTFLTVFMV